MNPRLGFTVNELALETAHSQRTIRRWIATYQITPLGQIGGRNRYDLGDILHAERDTRLAQRAHMFALRATV